MLGFQRSFKRLCRSPKQSINIVISNLYPVAHRGVCVWCVLGVAHAGVCRWLEYVSLRTRSAGWEGEPDRCLTSRSTWSHEQMNSYFRSSQWEALSRWNYETMRRCVQAFLTWKTKTKACRSDHFRHLPTFPTSSLTRSALKIRVSSCRASWTLCRPTCRKPNEQKKLCTQVQNSEM